jgi:hypothetical protein
MKRYVLVALAAMFFCALSIQSAAADTPTVSLIMSNCPTCTGLNDPARALNYALSYTFSNPGTRSTYLLIQGGGGTSAYFWVDDYGMPTSVDPINPNGPGGGGGGGGSGGGGAGGGGGSGGGGGGYIGGVSSGGGDDDCNCNPTVTVGQA